MREIEGHLAALKFWLEIASDDIKRAHEATEREFVETWLRLAAKAIDAAQANLAEIEEL